MLLGSEGRPFFLFGLRSGIPTVARFFKPQFLGDKWPLVDYIVELEGSAKKSFCFVQVKATRAGYTKKGNRLKVRVSKKDVQAMAMYPVPTYIVGIDEEGEKGYIISANGENVGSLSSLNTNFPLDLNNCDTLWKEVEAYWKTAPPPPKLTSTFSDSDWR